MQVVSLARLFEKNFAPYPQRWRTSSSAPIVSAQKIQLPTQSKQVNPTIAPVDSKPPLLLTPHKTPFMRKLSPTEIQFPLLENCQIVTEKIGHYR